MVGLMQDDPEGIEQSVLKEIACALFSRGKIGSGKGGELTGIGRCAFMDELGKRGIPLIGWDWKEYWRTELAGMRAMGCKLKDVPLPVQVCVEVPAEIASQLPTDAVQCERLMIEAVRRVVESFAESEPTAS